MLAFAILGADQVAHGDTANKVGVLPVVRPYC